MPDNLVAFILLVFVGIALILYTLPSDILETSKDKFYTKKILYINE